VLDGNDLLNDWGQMTPMELDVYVHDEAELDASNIADSSICRSV